MQKQANLIFRVSAVDDDVAGIEERHQLIDERVHGGAGLDEEHDASRLLQLRDHVLKSFENNIKTSLNLI